MEKKFNSRFVERNEIIKDKSENKVINDISNIYRKYWISSSLEESEQTLLDSVLMTSLYDYLLRNKLTNLSKSQLKKSSFEEIKKAIENQNAYSEIFYLNETYGLKIWNKQTEKKYTIELPLDTLTISVVFIENYALKGLADFITIGSAQDGGWSSISKNKLFCHKGEYDLDSEKFKISYLKHEANHFVDGLKYPNLSSADMEYRSKLIEFIYVKNEAQNLVASFINSASNENRNNAHAYANYTIIKHLSEKIFDKEYETDISKWGNIEVEEINKAAKEIYNENDKTLLNNTKITETI